MKKILIITVLLFVFLNGQDGRYVLINVAIPLSILEHDINNRTESKLTTGMDSMLVIFDTQTGDLYNISNWIIKYPIKPKNFINELFYAKEKIVWREFNTVLAELEWRSMVSDALGNIREQSPDWVGTEKAYQDSLICYKEYGRERYKTSDIRQKEIRDKNIKTIIVEDSTSGFDPDEYLREKDE